MTTQLVSPVSAFILATYRGESTKFRAKATNDSAQSQYKQTQTQRINQVLQSVDRRLVIFTEPSVNQFVWIKMRASKSSLLVFNYNYSMWFRKLSCLRIVFESDKFLNWFQMTTAPCFRLTCRKVKWTIPSTYFWFDIWLKFFFFFCMRAAWPSVFTLYVHTIIGINE